MNVTVGLPVVIAVGALIGTVVVVLSAATLFILLRRRKRAVFKLNEEENDRLARIGGHLSIADFHKLPTPSWKPSMSQSKPLILFKSASDKLLRSRRTEFEDLTAQQRTFNISSTRDSSPTQPKLSSETSLPPQRAMTKLSKPMVGPRTTPLSPAKETNMIAKKRSSAPISYRRPKFFDSGTNPKGPRSLILPRLRSVSSSAALSPRTSTDGCSKLQLTVRPSFSSKRSLSFQPIGQVPPGVPPPTPRNIAPYQEAQLQRARANHQNTQSMDSFASASSSIFDIDSRRTKNESATRALQTACSGLNEVSDDTHSSICVFKSCETSLPLVRPPVKALSSFHAHVHRESLPRNNSSALSMGLIDTGSPPKKAPTSAPRENSNEAESDDGANLSRSSYLGLKRSSRQPLPVVMARDRPRLIPSWTEGSKQSCPLSEDSRDRPISTLAEFRLQSVEGSRSVFSQAVTDDAAVRRLPTVATIPTTPIASSFNERSSMDSAPCDPFLASIWPRSADTGHSSATGSDDSSLQPEPLRPTSKVQTRRISELIGERKLAVAPSDFLLPPTISRSSSYTSIQQSPPSNDTVIFSPRPRAPSSVYPEDLVSDCPPSPRSAVASSPPLLPPIDALCAAPPVPPHSHTMRARSPLHHIFSARGRPGSVADASVDRSSVAASLSSSTSVAIGDLASQLRRMDSQCDAQSDAGFYFDLSGGGSLPDAPQPVRLPTLLPNSRVAHRPPPLLESADERSASGQEFAWTTETRSTPGDEYSDGGGEGAGTVIISEKAWSGRAVAGSPEVSEPAWQGSWGKTTEGSLFGLGLSHVDVEPAAQPVRVVQGPPSPAPSPPPKHPRRSRVAASRGRGAALAPLLDIGRQRQSEKYAQFVGGEAMRRQNRPGGIHLYPQARTEKKSLHDDTIMVREDAGNAVLRNQVY